MNGTNAYTSTMVFRDPGSWYWIMFTSNAGTMSLVVNGIYTFTPSGSPSIFNTAISHTIGYANASNYFDGIITCVSFIDGAALSVSELSAQDTTNNLLTIPRSPTSVTWNGVYGNNGFYLDFGDRSSFANIGLDTSGLSHDWTLSANISNTISDKVSFDVLYDVPSQYTNTALVPDISSNYCGLTSLSYSSGNPTDLPTWGGQRYVTTAAAAGVTTRVGTYAVSTGKWYFEWQVATAGDWFCGWINDTFDLYSGNPDGNTASQVYCAKLNTASPVTVSSFSGTTGTATSLFTGGAVGDIYGIAVDFGTGSMWISKNGTFPAGNPDSGTTPQLTFTAPSTSGRQWYPFVRGPGGGTVGAFYANFGQQGFTYTANVTLFKALNSRNLNTTISASSLALPYNYVYSGQYTGTGASLSNTTQLTTVGIAWLHASSTTGDGVLYDSSRGDNKQLITDVAGPAQTTQTQGVTGLGVNASFTVGTLANINTSAATYKYWAFRNNSSAQSITLYTGTGANRTVAVGLLAKFVIVKDYLSTVPPLVIYHVSLGATNYINFNTNAASAGDITLWNSTAPAGTNITVGTSISSNSNGGSFFAYAFAEVPGYSQFRSFVGTGQTSGVFVDTGFAPELVMIKASSTTGSWYVIMSNTTYPSSRPTPAQNVISSALNIETTAASSSASPIDFLSNGFKTRSTTGANINVSGVTYIYCAWASMNFISALAR